MLAFVTMYQTSSLETRSSTSYTLPSAFASGATFSTAASTSGGSSKTKSAQLESATCDLQRHTHLVSLEMSRRLKTSNTSKDNIAVLDSESEGQSKSLSKLMNDLERLRGLIELCKLSESNRSFYMNAWAYHFLKRWVLTVEFVLR